ncbi:MAG: hypothetical protein IJT30_10825 [Muribaculaceae bacterium]|nr:hypothetical protein [Muribaculaceae bacterium]
MKKNILFLAFAVTVAFSAVSQHKLHAYIADYDDTTTNIRNAPNGKVVCTLEHEDGIVLTLVEAVNGWWRIEGTIEIWGDDEREVQLKGSSTGYWVHNSVIGFTGTGGEETCNLYAKPTRKSRIVCEYGGQLLHPIEVRGHWVKVITEDGEYTGWFHHDNICFNPLTTCP